MRILALVTDAEGGYGGIARYNADFAGALARTPGIEDVLVLPRVGSIEDRQLAPRLRQERPVRGRFPYAMRSAARALSFRPDVIFSGHIYHGALALGLARLCRARLVSQLHGTEIWKPLRKRDLVPLVRSDLVFCVSRDTRTRYVSQAGGAHNALVVNNTVGREFVPGERDSARHRFGVDAAFVLLTVARLDSRGGYKGHERVLEALPHLAAPDGRPIVYLVAGVGEDRPRLERIAADLGVADRVRFLGKVAEADLPDLYRAADLFVMPSTGEGFGIVYIEAMACGTPALGLAAGGVPDALGDGELGTLIGAEDDLLPALHRLVAAPPPDREKLSAAIHGRFGAEAFQAKLGDALVRLGLGGSA